MMLFEREERSCSCERCKRACRFKPGWFLPGEVEKLAPHLGVSLEELFKTRLMVDWWADGVHPIFVLSPAVLDGELGAEFLEVPLGVCIFFKEGLCDIYPFRPFECHSMICDRKEKSQHREVALAWKPYREQIVELLGRSPRAQEGTMT